MIIDSKFKIWMATEKDGNARPTLNHVNIEDMGQEPDDKGRRPGMAIGMDGFLLAVVPVTLELGDVPGLVQRQAWEWMVKISGVRTHKPLNDTDLRGMDIDKYYRMGLDENSVTLMNDVTIPRLIKGMNESSKFPEWRSLFDLAKANEKGERELPEAGYPIAFDHILLGKLSAAMGSKMMVVTRLYKGQQFVVETENGSYPKTLPYGLLMPIHIQDQRPMPWKVNKS